MAEGTRDLIVVDEYFEQLEKYFKARNELETMLRKYRELIVKSRENAIKSGEAATALDEYIGYAERLQGKARDINDDLSTLAKDYIRAINAADDYLF